MNLERRIFKRKFIYRQRFINVCILRIKYGHRSERTIRGYKMYLFKMMHDIIQKNVCNYINLLTNGTDLREIPTHDDVLTDAYLMFDRCLQKFKVKKGHNFYYYLNKSLSRNFFREYKKIQNNSTLELTDSIEFYNPDLHYVSDNYESLLILKKLGCNELECRVAISKMNGEQITEFLSKNKSITRLQYQMAMRRIKMIVAQAKEEGKW